MNNISEDINFRRRWINHISLYPEVVDNPAMAEVFKSFAKRVLIDGYQLGYGIGYDEGEYDIKHP